MRIPVRAKVRRIEQAHTVSVFGTLNLDLWEVISWCLRKANATWFEKKFDNLKWLDLIIKLRKPSAEHQFSYLYEQLAARFWEVSNGKFAIKQSFKDKLNAISSPYAAATLILNEFFEACNDLTMSWQPPFECIEQKREVSDKLIVKKLNETMKQQVDVKPTEEESYEDENWETFVVNEFASKEEVEKDIAEQEAILDDIYEEPNVPTEYVQPVKKEKPQVNIPQTTTTIPWMWIPGYTGSYTGEMNAMERALYGN